jgi:hypothetical protein
MPAWVLEVVSFVERYPGMSPDAVLNMGLDCYDWLPVASDAFARAREMKRAADDKPAQFRRHGPSG